MEKATQSITRSYSRKVQLKQFEPVEIFASRTYQWYDIYPSKEEVAEKSEELYDECVEEVEEQLSKFTGPTDLEEANEELSQGFKHSMEKD